MDILTAENSKSESNHEAIGLGTTGGQKDVMQMIKEFLPDSEYRELLRSEDENLHLLIALIEKRFIDIELKLYRKKGKQFPDLPQKMLILHTLGLMEIINGKDIKTKDKAELLSLLLGEDQDNIEKTLSHYNDENNRLRKEKTYKYVFEKFKELGLNDDSLKVERIYTDIKKKKK